MFKVNGDTRNNPDQTGGCWPTAQQELLLRAALLPGAAAQAAWQQWRTEVDVEEDHLDLGSFRLLPLVYHNLHKQGIDDPLMGRLKGMHRRAWVMNQLQFQACTQVLQSFHAAGIATLVLKGAALLCRYYPDQGVRPMGDFDVLVPKRQVVQAIEVLDQLGWQPVGHPREGLTPDYFAIRHAQGFANPTGRQLDLHWHVLVTSLSARTAACSYPQPSHT
jgi:hypothetical protein